MKAAAKPTGAKSLRDKLLAFAAGQYETEPEYPWHAFPEYAVLRHARNKKWYGVIMDLPKNKIGQTGNATINVINLKCDPVFSGSLKQQPGILSAYHMNKENWITVVLDGTVPEELVFSLLDMSFQLTGGNHPNAPSNRA